MNKLNINDKNYKILCYIAGVLTVLIPWFDNYMAFVAVVIGMCIYFVVLKDYSPAKITLGCLSVAINICSLYIIYCMEHMDSYGIDALGTAIVYAIMYRGTHAIYLILSSILFFLYTKKFIFKLKYIIITIDIVAISFLCYYCRAYML